MGKLKLREIQADILNGHDYFEYEQTYRGENVTIIMSRREDRVLYAAENRAGALEFTLEEFVKLTYNQLLKRYNEFIFYTPYEKAD